MRTEKRLHERQQYDFMVDMGGRGVRLPANIRKQVGNDLWKYTHNVYWEAIPLDDIFDDLAQYGLVPVQEDGTPWSGFLVGREGQAHIPFAREVDGVWQVVNNSVLFLNWYKMESGRYELVMYLT